MDLFTLTLAGNIVAILTPFIKKGVEEFINEIEDSMTSDLVRAGAYKIKGLLDKLKEKFTGDSEAIDTLRYFENKPDCYNSILKDILKEKFDQDKDFMMELDRIVKDISQSIPRVNVIIEMTEGEDVTGLKAKQMRSGSTNINMKIEKGKKITGANIENIRFLWNRRSC